MNSNASSSFDITIYPLSLVLGCRNSLQKRLLEQEGVTVQPVPGGWQEEFALGEGEWVFVLLGDLTLKLKNGLVELTDAAFENLGEAAREANWNWQKLILGKGVQPVVHKINQEVAV